ncbi:MAG: SelB C-terminal domain-containing protein, partial [Gemmatimonadetes bacterium]|nr:SelB C-terminal domain-containing protein [Gemmatimonadota bacterium]
LRAEMCFHPGQRFILRGTSPLATVGGGEVMDLRPDRPRRVTPAERSAYALRARGEPSVAAYLAESPHPVADVAALARRWMMREADVLAEAEGGGELRAATGKGASLGWRAGADADLLGRLRSFVASRPRAQQIVSFDRLGRELRVRTALLEPWLHAVWTADGADAAYLRVHARLDRAGLVVHPGTVSFTPEEQRLAGPIVERLRGEGIRPARLRDFEREYGARTHLVERVIAKLAEQGRVVRVSPDFALCTEGADALHAAAASLPREGVTAAGFGQALGLSRKYSIPYLEYLNAQGLLRRDGDLHLPASPG